ncbi:MAG: ComF family protein, partial [Burkholderiales bacterium]
DEACQRVRETAPQAGLPWGERARNVRGAFSCGLDLAGKKVALLDDVMTSGSTANELSKTLRRNGARDISVWVVARTLPR